MRFISASKNSGRFPIDSSRSPQIASAPKTQLELVSRFRNWNSFEVLATPACQKSLSIVSPCDEERSFKSECGVIDTFRTELLSVRLKQCQEVRAARQLVVMSGDLSQGSQFNLGPRNAHSTGADTIDSIELHPAVPCAFFVNSIRKRAQTRIPSIFIMCLKGH